MMRALVGQLRSRLRERTGNVLEGQARVPAHAGTAGEGPGSRLMAGYVEERDHRSRWRRATRYGVTFVGIVFYSFFILLLPIQVMLPFMLPMIVLYGFALWSLPVTNRPPPKILDTLFWLYLGSLFLWPNYLALTIPGLPWITAARLLGAPLVLIVIWCAFTSAPFRAEMAKARAAMPVMIWAMFAFSVLQVISIGFSDALFITVNRVVNNLMTWTAMFFAAIWVFRDVAKVRLWIVAYVVMTAILCLMAIAEGLKGGVLWATSVPSFLKPPDPIVDEILAGSYRLTGQYRVQATQTTPLSLAEMLALAIPLMFYVLNRYPRPWVFAAMAALDVAIIYTLLLADSRLGFISLILGHMLALFYFGWQQWRRSRGSLVGPAITVMYPAAGAALVVVVLSIQSVKTRVLGSGQHQYSDQAREDQWRMGMEKIWESPLFGFGADRGGIKVGYSSPGGELTIDSYYLSILMDYGFLGFLLFYGMFIYAIAKSLGAAFSDRSADMRLLYAVFGIFLAEFLLIKSVLSQAANHPFIFMAFGALVALAAIDRQQLARDRRSG